MALASVRCPLNGGPRPAKRQRWLLAVSDHRLDARPQESAKGRSTTQSRYSLCRTLWPLRDGNQSSRTKGLSRRKKRSRFRGLAPGFSRDQALCAESMCPWPKFATDCGTPRAPKSHPAKVPCKVRIPALYVRLHCSDAPASRNTLSARASLRCVRTGRPPSAPWQAVLEPPDLSQDLVEIRRRPIEHRFPHFLIVGPPVGHETRVRSQPEPGRSQAVVAVAIA